jgi:hypothetical protein
MRLLRWFCVVFGGVLMGVGLALHGQVALARHMQNEVDRTFIVWRWLGKATFAFQGGETRMALAMREVPQSALRESDRAAWQLIGVGVVIALAGPWLRASRGGKARKRTG